MTITREELNEGLESIGYKIGNAGGGSACIQDHRGNENLFIPSSKDQITIREPYMDVVFMLDECELELHKSRISIFNKGKIGGYINLYNHSIKDN